MRFSVSLAEESGGNLTKSMLTYSPTAGVSVGDLLITCEDPYVENTTKTDSTTITTTGMMQWGIVKTEHYKLCISYALLTIWF